jgi:hypothetical protein
MSLDSRFVIASDLQSHFVDKTTGLPLQNGTITFYKDQARNEAKNVFILNNGPPYNAASYVDIGNEVTLGPGGNIMYNNNDVILYYFPYEGEPDNSDGTVELYYVVIKNGNDVSQKTLSAWPNTIAGSEGTDQNIKNYVPNGQFLVHNDLPETETYDAGEIRADETSLAAGGWYFVRENGSTADDFVTFTRVNDDTASPDGGARYWISISDTSLGADPGDKRDLRLRFNNVNTFSTFSDPAQAFTFAFYAENLNIGTLPVEVIIVKNFGDGGTAEVEIAVESVDITNTAGWKNVTLNFGDNSAYTLGEGNDDYVDICLRFPPDSTFSAQLTNFVLTAGEVAVTTYPATPESEAISESIAGGMEVPSYTGMNLYLTPRLTIEGMVWDDSEIGDIVMESQPVTYTNNLSTTTNRMLANGGRYKVSDYSPLGIPYRRLFNKYYSDTLKTPIYGTGDDFAVAGLNTGDTQIILSNNTVGTVTASSLGTTTFTVSTVHTSSASDYDLKCYMVDTATFYAEVTSATAVTAAIAVVGTPGPTVSNVQTGSSLLPDISQIVCPNGAGITEATAGTNYIKIYTTNTANFYYVWYQVDGAGATDPAPASGTGIKVDVLSTDTAAIVAQKTRTAMNNWQVTSITPVAASSITAGQYFRFYVTDATNPNWVVWFKTDGTGTQPVIASAKFIEVDVVKTGTPDTAAQVAAKIQSAINSVYFAAPDLRGYMPRARDNGAGVDPNAASRWSMVPGVIGDAVGTFQLSGNISHAHIPPGAIPPEALFADDNVSSNRPTGSDVAVSASNVFDGGSESRPVNFYATFAIKY